MEETFRTRYAKKKGTGLNTEDRETVPKVEEGGNWPVKIIGGKYQQAHVVSVMCGRERTNELSWNGQSVTRADQDSVHR